jgi:hypothetical protein
LWKWSWCHWLLPYQRSLSLEIWRYVLDKRCMRHFLFSYSLIAFSHAWQFNLFCRLKTCFLIQWELKFLILDIVHCPKRWVKESIIEIWRSVLDKRACIGMSTRVTLLELLVFILTFRRQKCKWCSTPCIRSKWTGEDPSKVVHFLVCYLLLISVISMNLQRVCSIGRCRL